MFFQVVAGLHHHDQRLQHSLIILGLACQTVLQKDVGRLVIPRHPQQVGYILALQPGIVRVLLQKLLVAPLRLPHIAQRRVVVSDIHLGAFGTGILLLQVFFQLLNRVAVAAHTLVDLGPVHIEGCPAREELLILSHAPKRLGVTPLDHIQHRQVLPGQNALVFSAQKFDGPPVVPLRLLVLV